LKNLKSSAFGILLAIAVIPLSACNPPLPPELQAQLADNSINCGSAPVTVAAPGSLTPFLEYSSFEYSEFCPAAGTATIAQDASSPADIFLTASPVAPTSCESYLSVPMMTNGATIVTSLFGLDGLIFDPITFSEVINGAVSSWSDPKIIALNPQFEPIDLPIIVSTKISKADAESIDSWLSRVAPDSWTGWPAGFEITDTEFDPNNLPPELTQDGGLVFAPFWYVIQNSLQTVQMKVDPNLDAVPSAGDNIASGASQLVLDSDVDPAVVKVDSAREPLPIPGYDVALAPWQALTPYYAHACVGAAEQDTKSFLRYLLRSSTQSSLPDFGYYGIPDEMRGKAIEMVSQGLPSPSPIAPDTAATP
jgi:ABC-type phosphate transport system substrate-binding protein